MMHPDCRAVLPWMPAPMGRHDGTAQNAGERQATQRFLTKLRQAHPPLQGLVTDDRLRAQAPHLETLHAPGLPSILGVQAGDQASLGQQGQAAEQAGRVPASARHDRAAGLVPRVRLLHDVPLHASHAEVRGHFLAYGERGQEKVQHFSWGTDLRVHTRPVLHRMRGGRARWKSDTETCNTLQNQGDNVAHTDGPGAQPRSVVLARLLLLACVVDHAQQLGGALCQAVWAQLGRTRRLWERRRTLWYAEAVASRRQLCAALLYGCKTSHPSSAVDASSSAPLPPRPHAGARGVLPAVGKLTPR